MGLGGLLLQLLLLTGLVGVDHCSGVGYAAAAAVTAGRDEGEHLHRPAVKWRLPFYANDLHLTGGSDGEIGSNADPENFMPMMQRWLQKFSATPSPSLEVPTFFYDDETTAGVDAHATPSPIQATFSMVDSSTADPSGQARPTVEPTFLARDNDEGSSTTSSRHAMPSADTMTLAPTPQPSLAAVSESDGSEGLEGGDGSEFEVSRAPSAVGAESGDGDSGDASISEEAPAPTVEGAVAQLSGSVGAPFSVLGTVASARTLSSEMRTLMELEDQDRLVLEGTSSRRRLVHREEVELDVSPAVVPTEGGGGGREVNQGPGNEDYRRHRSLRSSSHRTTMKGASTFEEHGTSGHHRTLADDEETSTREFLLIFINDPGETAAYGRAADAAVLLINGRENLATALNTTEDSVTLSDIVFSSTTAPDIDTDAAKSTFDDDDGASGAAVGIAVAVIIAACCATGCTGIAAGKSWLTRERRLREEARGKPVPKPTYERASYSSRDPGCRSPTARCAAAQHGGTSSTTSDGDRKNVCGRLAPTVSVGGLLHVPVVARSRGKRKQDFYDEETGGGGSGDRSVGRVSSALVGEDVVEHDYGDCGQAESFVEAVDGVYSEFEGQSEYDPVVPGGSVNDGVLSDGSSRFYCDDDQLSEWGTYVGGQEQGSLLGFPLRKASSRFSAGPRSQASFAAPSVAASGRSIQSSIVPSLANFSPAGVPAATPPPSSQSDKNNAASVADGSNGVGDGGTERGFSATHASTTVAAVPTNSEGEFDAKVLVAIAGRENAFDVGRIKDVVVECCLGTTALGSAEVAADATTSGRNERGATPLGRPSLDSAAESIAVSSVAVHPRRSGDGGAKDRNSQSIGGMTVPDCSHDSDRESLVSRVGSYALTDIAVGASERPGGAPGTTLVAGNGGGGGGTYSPTSTVLRSATGLSELASERDSYESDGYTNVSESPGTHSGWERAWMRQRDDARHFGGQ